MTIWTLLRTRSAAIAAQRAAEATKAQLQRLDTIEDFSSAISIMDEIKRLHRAAAWSAVPDRYAVLRRLLASINGLNPSLDERQKSVLSGAIVQFRTMEEQVEKAQAANRAGELDVARLNRIVSRQLDVLNGVMIRIRQTGI